MSTTRKPYATRAEKDAIRRQMILETFRDGISHSLRKADLYGAVNQLVGYADVVAKEGAFFKEIVMPAGKYAGGTAITLAEGRRVKAGWERAKADIRGAIDELLAALAEKGD